MPIMRMLQRVGAFIEVSFPLEGIKETSESEPLKRFRNLADGINTGQVKGLDLSLAVMTCWNGSMHWITCKRS